MLAGPPDLRGDGECTAAPNSIFGHSLTACCIEHDQTTFTAQDDWALAQCLVNLADDPLSYVVLAVAGLVYLAGLRLLDPLYQRLKGRR